MSKVETYTSTGSKLIHHYGAVQKLQTIKKGTPISLQVAPTSRCNLKCVFCSNTNRDKHEDLGVEVILELLATMRVRGLKTVEWTGGGDPTQYAHINECIEYAHSLGLQQGLISNGVAVKDKISQNSLDKLRWLRISMNCLDYVEDIELPDFGGTLGFSYVMNDLTNNDTIPRIKNYVEKYTPEYVRIVPNCQATHLEQEENNAKYSEFVKTLGEPFFYQTKAFEKPDNCWWGYFKPFLLHDGWVYPCSSVVLNEDAERQFHNKYRWVRAEQLPFIYDHIMLPFDPKNCSHCVFTAQNRQVEGIMKPNGMENFV